MRDIPSELLLVTTMLSSHLTAWMGPQPFWSLSPQSLRRSAKTITSP